MVVLYTYTASKPKLAACIVLLATKNYTEAIKAISFHHQDSYSVFAYRYERQNVDGEQSESM